MKNVFSPEDVASIVARIHQLTPTSQGLWGKMTVSQMLAHCNVTYEMVYENIHPKPNAIMRFILKMLVKDKVVNDKPYTKNVPTAPQFIIKSDKDFETERNRLVGYITKTQEMGEKYFEGRESHSFGKMTAKEWNNMFAKHLDHHLNQFGA